jgi:hypothetical protein
MVMLAQYDLGTVRNSYDDKFVSIDRRVADIERSMAQLLEACSRCATPAGQLGDN